MISLQNKPYLSGLIILFANTFINLNTFAQESQNSVKLIDTISETVMPLAKDNNNSNLTNSSELKSFLKELEISNAPLYEDNQEKNRSSNFNNNDIVFDQNNNGNNTKVNSDSQILSVLEELSNDNILIDEIVYDDKNNEITSIDGDTTNFQEDNNIIFPGTFPIVSTLEMDNLDISSIGLDQTELEFLFPIWKNISINRASVLLQNSYHNVDSKVIKDIMIQMVIKSAEPPSGETILKEDFILMRLKFLANSGKIEHLKNFIDLLPSDEIFDNWRAWRVQEAFLQKKIKSDDSACKIVSNVSANNDSDFWKMAHIFCLVIQGYEDDAFFDSALLKASGSGDENFFNLLDIMLGDKNTEYSIDTDSLTLLDVIMMDQIRNTIPSEFFIQSSIHINKSLLNIEYMQPDSRALILDKLVELKLISVQEVKELYSKIGDTLITSDEALLSLYKNPGPQSRADVWNALSNEDKKEVKIKNIITNIAIETKNGRPIQALNLYLPLLIEEKESKSEVAMVIENLEIINHFIYYDKKIKLGSNVNSENNLSKFFLLKEGSVWDYNFFKNFNIIDIIPILKVFEITIRENDFLEVYLNMENKDFRNNNINPILSLSLSNSVQKERFAETIFISSIIVGKQSFNNLSSIEILEIIKAWISIGLNEEAKSLAREWIAQRLIGEITKPFMKFDS